MLPVSTQDRRVWAVIGAVLLLGLLLVPFSQAVLGVQYTYTVRTVAMGGALLGVVSGVLGSFAVLRHESLIGDALSHAALPGVALAFLLAGRELGALLIGAGIASWLGVQFIRAVTSTTRIKQDAAMGIVLAAWFAAGIALRTYIQARADASQAGLDSFIFGQAAAMVERDVQVIALVGAAAFVVIVLLWKEFKLVTFDPAFAGANGFRVGLLNTLLSTLIVIAIILGLQLAGVVLMVGMLIAPGIAARQWTHKLGQMVVLSALFGAFAGSTGAVLSAVDANVPTGPMVIVAAFAIVLLSMSFAPERGIIWTRLRQRGDRQRFAAQIMRRDLYRYATAHGEADHPVPDAWIRRVDSVNARVGLPQLERRGQVQRQGDHWVLTAQGAAEAARDADNQSMWEAYRFYADLLRLPLIAEDRQQDIRALLPEDALQRLRQQAAQHMQGAAD